MKVKKEEIQKMYHKKCLKFEDCRNCLEATQFENKIIQLRKNKNDLKIFIENRKEFIKKTTILKSQQRLKSIMILLKKLIRSL